MAGVGAPLATAFVRIKPDDTGFGRDLKKQVEQAVAPAARAVDQGLVKKLQQQIEESNRRIARSQLDVRGAEISLAEARKKLTEVTADATATDEDKAKASLAVDKADNQRLRSLAAVAKAQDTAATASQRLKVALAGEAVEIRKTDDDTSRLAHTLREELDRGLDLKQFSTLAQKIRDVRTIASATIQPISDFAQSIARMAVAAGAASAALVGGTGLGGILLALAGALAQVAGAAPLAATGIIGLASVIGTIKAATAGVSDAFKNVVKDQLALAAGAKLSKAQLAKLDQSLTGLAPNARKFVVEFAKIFPELRKVQQAVQQRFFTGFAGDLRLLAARYMPDVSRAGVAMAAVLNQTVRGAVARLLTSTTQWNLASVLAVARRSVEGFAPILARLPALFVNIAAAAGPAFQRLAGDLGRVLATVVDQLTGAVDSGALTAGINRGIAAVKGLGSIVGSVFSSIHSAVRAASAAVGGDLLGSLGAVIKKFADFAKSAKGQNTLRGIFAAALPVLRSLGGLLQLVGPELAALAPVVLNLAKAFITGLRPVIPVAAQLAKTLGTALASVLPAVSQVAVAIGGALTAAIRILQPVIGPLANAIASLLSPTGVLTAAFRAIAPVLVILANGIGQVVTILSGGLIAVLNTLAPVLPSLATAVATLAVAIAGALAGALKTIAPVLPQIVALFVQMVPAITALLPVVAQLAPVFAQIAQILVGQLVAIMPQLIPALVSLATSFVQIVAAVAPLIPLWVQITAAFTPLIVVVAKLAATLSKVLVYAFQTTAAGIAIATEGIAKSIKFVGDIILGAIIGILQAASHLPFVGGEFAKAATAVRDFRDKFDTSMQGAINSAATARTNITGAMYGVTAAVKSVPGLKEITVRVTDRATGVVENIKRTIASVHGKDVVVTVTNYTKYGPVTKLSRGGFVTGGIPGVDSVPALLTPGEYVESVPEARRRRTTRQADRVDLGRSLTAAAQHTTAAASSTAPVTGAAGGRDFSPAALRDALAGMSIRFDGDGLARLVTGRQAYATAAGGRR